MLKKTFLVAGVLSFAFFVLIVSVFRSGGHPRPSLAAARLKFSVSPQPSLTVTPVPKVDYYLVYPGMLPDHFLYKLKMVRDRGWFWLTTDKVKRGELLLLFADKRVGAGKILIEGNKAPLGISTLAKGEKYLERAIQQTQLAKNKGREVSSLSGKLRKAALKHEEILLELKEKVNQDGILAIDNLLELVKTLKQETEKL